MKIEKSAKGDFALHIPKSLIYFEDEMDVGLYVSFNKENLERIFKASGFEVILFDTPNEKTVVSNLGVGRNILLWVVKEYTPA
jgi:hypothetical protein